MAQYISFTVASGGTSTSALDIRQWPHVSIDVGTITSGAIYLQVARSLTGTFRRVQDVGVYSAGSGILDWEVPNGTGNRTILCRPASRFDYCKIEFGVAQTDGVIGGLYVDKNNV